MAEAIERLNELAKIPAVPGSALRLVNALNGDALDLTELERIVRTDEAIATAVLRVANSAAHGTGERSFTLKESIGRLGTANLQKIALSLSCGKVLAGGGEGYGLIRGELWRGAMCGALAAELIAKDTGLEDPGVCFVAGLIRDIGKLAMSRLFDAGELEAAFTSDHPGEDQIALEQRVFGFDHAEAGYRLASLWKFPDRLADAVRYHHKPPCDEKRDVLYDIVHCADSLCSLLAVGVGYDGLSYQVSASSAEAIGMDDGALERYLPEVYAELQKMEASVITPS